MTSVVDGLLDELTAGERPVDLVAGFSQSMPVAVISRLMGLDGVDTKRLSHWSDHVVSATAHSPQAIEAAIGEFGQFAAELVAERRARPGEDLVSVLVQAADLDGDLPESQLVTLVCSLVVAGHETTMTALGNHLVYLLSEGLDAGSGSGPARRPPSRRSSSCCAASRSSTTSRYPACCAGPSRTSRSAGS